MHRRYAKKQWTEPVICTKFIHGMCEYGRKCRDIHPKTVKLCKNYFSEIGCKYNERCHFSHQINITLPHPLLCFRINHTYSHDKNYLWLEDYYTKDGKMFYDNKECIQKNLSQKNLLQYDRKYMINNYAGTSAISAKRDYIFRDALRMVEDYKQLYCVFSMICKMDLILDLKHLIFKLFVTVCDSKYMKLGYKPIEERFHRVGN